MTGRHTTRHITSTLALSTALAVLCAFGCSSGKRIAKTNDALRIQREDLRERVESLEGENAELHVKIAELMQTGDTELSDDVLAALPRIASIELTRFSIIWTEGGSSEARFFIVPKDGQGRFVPAVGTLELRVVATGQSGESPLVLSELVVSPTEIRAAYITGIGGAAYAFRLPLQSTPDSSVVLRVVFKDALTGATHIIEKLIEAPSALELDQ